MAASGDDSKTEKKQNVFSRFASSMSAMLSFEDSARPVEEVEEDAKSSNAKKTKTRSSKPKTGSKTPKAKATKTKTANSKVSKAKTTKAKASKAKTGSTKSASTKSKASTTAKSAKKTNASRTTATKNKAKSSASAKATTKAKPEAKPKASSAGKKTTTKTVSSTKSRTKPKASEKKTVNAQKTASTKSKKQAVKPVSAVRTKKKASSKTNDKTVDKTTDKIIAKASDRAAEKVTGKKVLEKKPEKKKDVAKKGISAKRASKPQSDKPALKAISAKKSIGKIRPRSTVKRDSAKRTKLDKYGVDFDAARALASLPMYDWPELVDDNNRLWLHMSICLADFGFRPPLALNHSRSGWSVWTDPDMLVSQTCGLPLMSDLRGQVTLLGTPAYAIDCAPGKNFSVFIVNEHSHAGSLEEFSAQRYAYNDEKSQSGYNVFPASMARYGRFPQRWNRAVKTGSHRASIRAIAEGKADIAAIDGVCWELAKRYDEAASRVRVIGRSEVFPGLPLVTNASRNIEEIERLKAAMIEIFETIEADLAQKLLLRGFVTSELSDYLPIEKQWRDVEALLRVN